MGDGHCCCQISGKRERERDGNRGAASKSTGEKPAACQEGGVKEKIIIM